MSGSKETVSFQECEVDTQIIGRVREQFLKKHSKDNWGATG